MLSTGALMESDNEVLTAEEAATLLKVSNKTVLKLAREGDLPGQKIGRAWRFCRSELLAHVGCSSRVPSELSER
jgi:excisionase family DNA binding protein